MNESLQTADRARPTAGSRDIGRWAGQPHDARPGNSSLAVGLSFLWPGLGQLYLGQRRRAAAYALPWALLLIMAVIGLAVNGPAMLVWLLVPSVTLLVIALLALHGVWSVLSIVDASGRSRPAARRSSPAFALALVLGLAVATLHLGAGWTLQSVSRPERRSSASTSPRATPTWIARSGATPPSRSAARIPCPSGGSGRGTFGDEPSLAPSATIEPGPPDEPVDPLATDDPNEAPPALPCGSPSPGTSPGGGEVITGHIGAIPAHGPINVLFVGIDSGLNRMHALTDTLFVASFDQDTHKLTMISIPRDTGRAPLYIGGTFRSKFNEFLGYAGRHPELFPEGGVKALMNEVGYILGIDIHFYAATNLEGFPVLVDLMGVTVTNQNQFWLDSGEWRTRTRVLLRRRQGARVQPLPTSSRQQRLGARCASSGQDDRPPAPRTGAGDDPAPARADRPHHRLARTNAKPVAPLPALLPILIGASNVDPGRHRIQPYPCTRDRLPTSENGRGCT